MTEMMRAIRCANCNEPTGQWFDAQRGAAPEAYCRFCVNSPEVTGREQPRMETPPTTTENIPVDTAAILRDGNAPLWTPNATLPNLTPLLPEDNYDGQYRCQNCHETNCFDVEFSGAEHICRDDGREIFRPLIVDGDRVRATVTCYSCHATVPETDWEWG